MKSLLMRLSLINLFFPLFIASVVHAQLQVTLDTSITPCKDFATNELQNPWDMSDTADVNYFVPNDVDQISGASFSGGLFSGTTTKTAGGHFYLVSPQIGSLQPVGGRWGQNNPIDVTKYKTLTVRMSLDTYDPSGGLRSLWNRSTGYSNDRTYTSATSTWPGWHTYTIDLTSVGIDSISNVTSGWSSGSITGFGLYPTVVNQKFSIDFVRLEDPSTCGSTSASYSATVSGNDDLYSLYVDDDSTPLNGYHKKLVSAGAASGSTSVSIDSLGLPPGTYKVNGFLSSDYAILEQDIPWNMDNDQSIGVTGGISGGTFANGLFSGTASSSSPTIYLRIQPGHSIQASKYSKLSFKLTKSTKDPVNIFWDNGGVTLYPAVADADNDNVWTVDLAGQSGWTGSISTLIIQPTVTTGNSFSLDFAALRKSGYVTTDAAPTISLSSGSLNVSAPPLITVMQPDHKGGEAIRPWNMTSGDFDFSLNVTTDIDTSNPAEQYTSYLPDVRLVDGRRGNFFKGTNVAGNDDPNDYILFPFTDANPYTIDASQFHRMCMMMELNRSYDLALGSVTKMFYGKVGGEIEEFDAWATIYDGWSGKHWYEYCTDLADHPREDGLKTWGGTIDLLRIDPHEFHFDSCCDNTGNPIGNPISATYYYDWVKLRKDDVSNGRYALRYDLSDADTTSPTMSFAYNTTKSVTNATAISASALSCSGRVCIWDTSSVAAGNYYIVATANDGTNSNSSVSTGPVKIANDSSVNALVPRLEVQSPTSAQTVCSNMQIKGYALVENRYEDITAVQVFVDDVFFTAISPDGYSPRAVSAYPSADSSNAGFDGIYSVSSLSTGSHQVQVVAYASDGSTTSQTIAITKSVGCTDPAVVADTDPSGVPIAPTIGATATPTPTPSGDSLTITGKHLAKGDLTLNVAGIFADTCSVRILASAKSSNVSEILFTVTESAAGVLALKAKNIKVKKAKVSGLFFAAQQVCSGSTTTSSAVQVKFKSKAGLASAAAIIRKLKKQLGVAISSKTH